MTGRGRPRQAKSPDSKCAKNKGRPKDVKQTSPKCAVKHITDGKQNGTAKEEKPKQPKKQPEVKPSAQSGQKKAGKPPGEAAKAKACAGRAKKPELPADRITQTQREMPEETPTDSPKPRGARARSPAAKPKAPKEAAKPRCEDKAPVDITLSRTLQQLKIRKDERSDASKVVNAIIDQVVTHLKVSESFKEVEAPLRTGSYYENLKISNPDEFDVMLPVPVARVSIEPFGDDGAFYSVSLKRGQSPLQRFQEDAILSASKMLTEFREEVKKSVKEFKEWEVVRKKKGCPAVTMTTTVNSITISLDVVLCLMVRSSWPAFTKDGFQIDGWLGTKVKQEHKRKPYYLVPKYEGSGMVENNGVFARDVWRVSFSHVEKAVLKNHGAAKTCCEKGGTRCCRKDCLKLLKHLLGLLKEKDPSFDKFCSYHAKTTLLHACASRSKDSDWSALNLGDCFQLLLRDLIGHLERGDLYNFFIPSQNLLSGPGQRKCKSLAIRLREQCEKGFPIFK